jgi:hypothetical protein
MKIKCNIVIAFFVSLLFCSCGEGVIVFGFEVYIPKIVVEGYLQFINKVSDIIIGRNFPINGAILLDYFIADAKAKITDLETGEQYQLSYNRFSRSYAYTGNDLVIGYNKSYELEVEANIDGKTLFTKSVTTTPQEGFRVNRDLSVLGEMRYNQKDEFGKTQYFNLVFDPSPGTGLYVLSINALEVSLSNYIYDNIYSGFSDSIRLTYRSVADFKEQSAYQLNINSQTLGHNFKIEWDKFWFYSNFEIILLACDKNFKEYFLTIDRLMEVDGNYHEPLLNFEGDGLGVFGSYIADTLYCRVIK